MQCLLVMSLAQWFLLSYVRNRGSDGPFEYSERLLDIVRSNATHVIMDWQSYNNSTNWFFRNVDYVRSLSHNAIGERIMILVEGSVDKVLNELVKGAYVWPTDLETVKSRNYPECAEPHRNADGQGVANSTTVICRYTVLCVFSSHAQITTVPQLRPSTVEDLVNTSPSYELPPLVPSPIPQAYSSLDSTMVTQTPASGQASSTVVPLYPYGCPNTANTIQ